MISWLGWVAYLVLIVFLFVLNKRKQGDPAAIKFDAEFGPETDIPKQKEE